MKVAGPRRRRIVKGVPRTSPGFDELARALRRAILGHPKPADVCAARETQTSFDRWRADQYDDVRAADGGTEVIAGQLGIRRSTSVFFALITGFERRTRPAKRRGQPTR